MDVVFAGLQLFTLPGRVMTPRVASERLVAAARARIGDRPVRVADVGTGSGAIAIALALACPSAEVWATDNSRGAVRLARANVRRHGLAGRVRVRHGDLLEPAPGLFDVVLANLPYVPAASAADHPDLASEPFEAVFAPGDGLGHYRSLVTLARTRLAVDGLLLLQVDRQVVAASFAELPALEAALAAGGRGDAAAVRGDRSTRMNGSQPAVPEAAPSRSLSRRATGQAPRVVFERTV